MQCLGHHKYKRASERISATPVFVVTLKADRQDKGKMPILKILMRRKRFQTHSNNGKGKVEGEEIHLWVVETSCRNSSVIHHLSLVLRIKLTSHSLAEVVRAASQESSRLIAQAASV